LKAVTMGMVTAIALFWSNKPNPAIYKNLVKTKTLAFSGSRFRSLFFLCLMQDSKAVTMGVRGCGDYIF
jgi:hypothetical protein